MQETTFIQRKLKTKIKDDFEKIGIRKTKWGKKEFIFNKKVSNETPNLSRTVQNVETHQEIRTEKSEFGQQTIKICF